jgi:hypothetical protein
MYDAVVSSHAVGKHWSGVLFAYRWVAASVGRYLISPLWIASFTHPSAWVSCSGRASRGLCCSLIAAVRWLTMSDPRMLGEVASSLWRGRMLVGGLTRLAAAQSALAGMGFDWLAGWQAGRSLCRAVWPRDKSIDGHGDQLTIQSSCMLQYATVERMFQISQMSDLKQSLSLCARTRVAATSNCRLLETLRASVQCPFAPPMLLLGIVKRLWSVALRWWSCERWTLLPTSFQSCLVAVPDAHPLRCGCCSRP